MYDDNPNNSSLGNRTPPAYQENPQQQPWFVSGEDKSKGLNQKTKATVKKTASVLFPLIGILFLVSIVAGVIFLVARIY